MTLLAGLNVLALMNDHTAVALKYGIDHNVASLTEPRVSESEKSGGEGQHGRPDEVAEGRLL